MMSSGIELLLAVFVGYWIVKELMRRGRAQH